MEGIPQTRTPFEVVLEYLLVTNTSAQKVTGKLVSELESYYNFYGYKVTDSASFVALMTTFLSKYKESEAILQKYKALNTTYELVQKEAAYKGIKLPTKEQETEFTTKKKKHTKFMINYRIVTPLFIAIEQEMSQENSKPVLVSQKTTESPYDIFPLGVFKAVFTYIGVELLKAPRTTRYLVIGNFTVIVLEISPDELKGIHTKLGLEMAKGKGTHLRIVKPYRVFYNALVSVLLKFGLANFLTVDLADLMAASENSLKEIWRPELKVPVKAFYGWCRFLVEKKAQWGIVDFFENLRCQMFKEWETNVVVKAESFQKIQLDHS